VSIKARTTMPCRTETQMEMKNRIEDREHGTRCHDERTACDIEVPRSQTGIPAFEAR